MKLENPVQMATIGAAHGIRGEVRVKAWGYDPMTLADYGSLWSADGRKFRITHLRPAKTVVVVKFKGINSRDEAESLNGIDLFIDRSALPDDTGEDEFYVTDLVGCSAFNADNILLGKVVAVPNFGAGDLIEIRLEGTGKTVLIEFSRANVPDVDLQERRLTVCLPEEVSERDTL